MTDDYGNQVVPEPARTFDARTSQQAVDYSTIGIIVTFGLTVLAVVLGALWLASQDKALPGEIIALASVALTFMGKAIAEGVKDA